MVEKDPGKLKAWRDDLREKLVLLRRIYNIRADSETGRLEAETRDSRHRADILITEDWTYEKEIYVYELDLDNMIFLYQRYPVYHLDHMPPEDVFYRSCEIVEGNIPDVIDEFYQDTPEEYRFSLSRLSKLAPVVEDLEITTYEESSIDVLSDPSSVLPSSSPNLTPAGDVSLHLLASILSFYRRQQPVVMYHDIALINSRRITSERGLTLCSLFAAMALFPLHIVGLPPGSFLKRGPWHDFFSRSHEDFWFIRRHICVTFGSHLLDERNAKYHISALIDRIVSDRNTPQVTYGVVFSLFHCIVVRIDKLEARCRFIRTEVLEFLPPLHVSESFMITPGIELLTRLGHLKGEDDLKIFHSCLSPRWWTWRGPSRHPNFEPRTDVAPLNHPVFAPHAPRLPLEIMMLIASEIERPTDLFDFALASRLHMAAAIPRMRLPQVWGRDALARYDRTVCYILDARVTDNLPATFETRHKDDSLLLQLRYSSRLSRKKPQRLGMMEWDGTTPMAYLMFGKSGGHSSGGYHFDDDPWHSYAEAHAEVAFVTGYRIETGENEDEDEEDDR
ncbi:hypothetical protein EIP86_004659 [Pleurotus ostreatoroseus]|nr:hypothetical protein EIP86_004659 [Pleurotus ostreatoroseus]